MVQILTQITRIKNVDTSETLRKHTDGTTLPYSLPNLDTMLVGVTDPVFVLQKINSGGYTYQARNQTEFTEDFETTWNLLLTNPDQPFGKL